MKYNENVYVYISNMSCHKRIKLLMVTTHMEDNEVVELLKRVQKCQKRKSCKGALPADGLVGSFAVTPLDKPTLKFIATV